MSKELEKLREELCKLVEEAQKKHPINGPADCVRIGFNYAVDILEEMASEQKSLEKEPTSE